MEKEKHFLGGIFKKKKSKKKLFFDFSFFDEKFDKEKTGDEKGGMNEKEREVEKIINFGVICF